MRPAMSAQLLRAFAHQRWIPRGRDRVVRFFSNPDTCPSTKFDVPFFGLRYSGDLANFCDWSVFYYGAYSRYELLLLRDIAQQLEGPVYFFDVGANVGQHSLFMTQYAHSVYSFEPFPVVAAEYRRKMSRANASNWTLFPVALGDSDSLSELSIPSGANLGTATLTQHLPGNASGERISVQIARGDDFFRENNLPPISLMKFDVEGYEATAMKGLADRLRSDRPIILAEISGPSRSGFVDEANFHAHLYPEHSVFEVRSVRDDYRLAPFHLESAQEILIVPNERLRALKIRGLPFSAR